LAGWSIWLQFLLVTGVITFSGTRLSRYGDILAEKTGMGRTWLGLVVLAAITSLPEFATGVSAVFWVDAPDITVGDLLGSCVFNLLILAVVDLLYPESPALTAADQGHLLAACFGMMMLGLAVMGLLAANPVAIFAFMRVSLIGPMLIICYLAAMRILFRYQRRERAAFLAVQEEEEKRLYDHITLRSAAWKFSANALGVMAAGAFLPQVAESLAHLMGWQQSMVGTIFVAASTSLPELVVTLGALRLGAVDLAVGNLFGSNLINLAFLGMMALLYVKAPILQVVSGSHAGTGLMAIIMTAIAGAELVYRPQKKVLRWLSIGTFFMVFLYAANIFIQMMAR
jgi:cation:H+ antiporter